MADGVNTKSAKVRHQEKGIENIDFENEIFFELPTKMER